MAKSARIINHQLGGYQDAPYIEVNEELTSRVNGENNVILGCPVGTIVIWSGPIQGISGLVEPAKGWLLCNGELLGNDVKYSKLSQVIGNTYNDESDLNTDCRLPNFLGRFPLGLGRSTSEANYHNLGTKGGEEKHALTQSEMPRHNHKFDSDNGDQNVFNPHIQYRVTDATGGSGELETRYAGGSGTAQSPSNGAAHENMPPYLTMSFIIKYK